jgi:hypothetical protein
MTTVRVVSWNIESLGDAKSTVADPKTAAVNQSEIVNFINLVVRVTEADLVGIMELKSGIGATIRNWLLPRLNNGAPKKNPYQWKGAISSRQDGGTQEEALYLWKEQAGTLTADMAGYPAAVSSPGIVDKNLLHTTLDDLHILGQPAQELAFINALSQAGYVEHGTYQGKGKKRLPTLTWRTNGDKWYELYSAKKPAAVDFGTVKPPVPMNLKQRQALAAQLIGTDILRFTNYGERSPFLGNFVLGKGKTLMVGMLHAPGPQARTRTDCINVIGLSMSAAAAANLVVMGDFNIGETQGNLTGVEYERTTVNGHYTFAQVSPRSYQQVFWPIENAPLNAKDQPLGPDTSAPRTTVIDGYVVDGTPATTILANTFDKMFFRGNATAAKALTAANPYAWNVPEYLDPADTEYWKDAAQSALTFFRAFRGDAYLAKADASLAKKEAKLQKTYNQNDASRKNLTAKINGMKPSPPKNAAVRARLKKVDAAAIKAGQQLFAVQMQRTAIKNLRTLVSAPARKAPTGVGTALAIYREAVSDHIPISLDLTA